MTALQPEPYSPATATEDVDLRARISSVRDIAMLAYQRLEQADHLELAGRSGGVVEFPSLGDGPPIALSGESLIQYARDLRAGATGYALAAIVLELIEYDEGDQNDG